MALVDLKRTKQERKERSKPSPMDGEDYPYGLRVHLGHDELQKLGIDTLPKAGSKVHLRAHAHVASVEDRQRDGGKPERSMSLELRHMSLGDEGPAEGEVDQPEQRGAKRAMDDALSNMRGPKAKPKGKRTPAKLVPDEDEGYGGSD